MPDDEENISMQVSNPEGVSPDYARVLNPARIAVYDDNLIAPRIITVDPTTTTEFIQNLAVTIDEQARNLGGKISYTVILEVTENFIHAQFKEIVVSILDGGNTIRFTDQGPGIEDVEKAVRPGFTSAVEPMKRYIRGVGSGLPIVHDWMELKNGHISIDSNIGSGAAVTISLVEDSVVQKPNVESYEAARRLSEKEEATLRCFVDSPVLGITELSALSGMSPSSVSYQLRKLEQNGLIRSTASKKRELTEFGNSVIQALA